MPETLLQGLQSARQKFKMLLVQEFGFVVGVRFVSGGRFGRRSTRWRLTHAHFCYCHTLFLLPDFVELAGHSQQLELRLLPREGGIEISHPTLVLGEARFFHFAEI